MIIKKNNGLTLIELMVVIAITSILNSIFIPAYKDYVLRAKATEGFSALANMKTKMEQYFQDNRTYTGACLAGTSTELPNNLTYFSLECSDLEDNTYTITATAPSLGFSYSINESDVKKTLSLPSGWSLSGDKDVCWIRDKNGQC